VKPYHSRPEAARKTVEDFFLQVPFLRTCSQPIVRQKVFFARLSFVFAEQRFDEFLHFYRRKFFLRFALT
jgi:hypothetical protein